MLLHEAQKATLALLELLNCIEKADRQIKEHAKYAKRVPSRKEFYLDLLATTKEARARLIIRYNRKLMAIDLLTN